MTVRTVLRLAAGAALALAITACGGSDDSPETAQATPVQTTAAQSAPSAATTAGAAATSAAQGTAAAAAATASGPQVVEIKAAEQGDKYMYEPRDLTVRPGAVTVTLSNSGPSRPHTFNVRNKNGSGDLVKLARVEVGKTGTVEFTVTEEGTYEIYCALPGHADRGQKGTLTVTRS